MACELTGLLNEYGVAPGSEPARQMMRYLALLKKWSARVSLTAAKDWAALSPLFREAIWASGLYPVEANTLLDIGSGAGFPAIPLRILIPRIQLEMVESRGKKAAFLETVVGELGMSGISVHNRRLGDYLNSSKRTWDCISWKGLKLGRNDLLLLLEHAHAGTQFWMFHGRELAAENPETVSRHLELISSQKCAASENRRLSVYRLR